MTEQAQNIVTVDGVDHNVEDMTQEQQYYVAQLRSIKGKIQNNQFELDQLNAAQTGFSSALSASLAKEPEEAASDD